MSIYVQMCIHIFTCMYFSSYARQREQDRAPPNFSLRICPSPSPLLSAPHAKGRSRKHGSAEERTLRLDFTRLSDNSVDLPPLFFKVPLVVQCFWASLCRDHNRSKESNPEMPRGAAELQEVDGGSLENGVLLQWSPCTSQEGGQNTISRYIGKKGQAPRSKHKCWFQSFHTPSRPSTGLLLCDPFLHCQRTCTLHGRPAYPAAHSSAPERAASICMKKQLRSLSEKLSVPARA